MSFSVIICRPLNKRICNVQKGQLVHLVLMDMQNHDRIQLGLRYCRAKICFDSSHSRKRPSANGVGVGKIINLISLVTSPRRDSSEIERCFKKRIPKSVSLPHEIRRWKAHASAKGPVAVPERRPKSSP